MIVTAGMTYRRVILTLHCVSCELVPTTADITINEVLILSPINTGCVMIVLIHLIAITMSMSRLLITYIVLVW